MKRKILAAVIPALLAAATANAAEIYNKDGNKLDLYGKAVGRHVWTTTGDSKNADQTYAQIGFKGETQINTDLTGFGQWEYRTKADRAEGEQQNSNLVRLAFAGLKYAEVGSSIMVVTTVSFMMLNPIPIWPPTSPAKPGAAPILITT